MGDFAKYNMLKAKYFEKNSSQQLFLLNIVLIVTNVIIME